MMMLHHDFSTYFGTHGSQVPDKLSAAVEDFRAHASDLSFVLTLGDIINGNREQPVRLSQARSSFPTCEVIFWVLHSKVYH